MRHRPLELEHINDPIHGCGPATPIEEPVHALDEASRLPTESPGWMFKRQGDCRRRQLQGAAAHLGADR